MTIICLRIALSVSPRGYVRRTTREMHQMFGACFLRSWLGLPLAIALFFIFKRKWTHMYIATYMIPLPVSVRSR